MRFSGKIILLLCFICSACASKKTARDRVEDIQDSARPRAASFGADSFMRNYRSPADERPYHAWEFYFKHCALVSRNPIPNKTEYDCAEPY